MISRPRIIAIVILAIAAFVIGNGFDALTIFLLTGTLPGTSYTLPSSVMFAVCTALFSLILGAVLSRPLARLLEYSKEQATMFRTRLPKKRFQS